jgi:hypothetical protein
MNLYGEFLALVPAAPLLIGEVADAYPNGTARVLIVGGSEVLVRGSGYAVGARVFVRGGAIEGVAPALPVVTAEV